MMTEIDQTEVTAKKQNLKKNKQVKATDDEN